MSSVPFVKYHGLGNDYIVIDARNMPQIRPEQIQRICHRNYGVGADGILHGPFDITASSCAVRIYNPDGSEAEKSGNGLRIFTRFLFDQGLIPELCTRVHTLGGEVAVAVSLNEHDLPESIAISMGTMSFKAEDCGVKQHDLSQVWGHSLSITDQSVEVYCASIGNPHCVVFTDEPNEQLARSLGPQLETHPLFSRKINVQFVKIIDKNNIFIEIWERGAGYTLASGTSSLAAAAVCVKRGLCNESLRVHMPGGVLEVAFDASMNCQLKGPVQRVCEGLISPEAFGDVTNPAQQ